MLNLGAAMAAPVVTELSRFGDRWCTSKALAVITASAYALCHPHGWHRAQALRTLDATFPVLDLGAALAAPAVAELSQFSNCWCTSTAGPTVDSDSKDEEDTEVNPNSENNPSTPSDEIDDTEDSPAEVL
ncbi:hypothetical protein K439DRAFT_1618180 [Ramaria rubella]|nr:hypothetical protein K439DRAFT_1618180 [Ramaria rubella]